MAQRYTILDQNGTATLEITDDTDTFRLNVRNGQFHIDQELTSTGFDGTENTDWKNISVVSYGISTKYRIGVRSYNWVIDQTLTSVGFDGIEDTDWTNLEKHRLP